MKKETETKSRSNWGQLTRGWLFQDPMPFYVHATEKNGEQYKFMEWQVQAEYKARFMGDPRIRVWAQGRTRQEATLKCIQKVYLTELEWVKKRKPVITIWHDQIIFKCGEVRGYGKTIEEAYAHWEANQKMVCNLMEQAHEDRVKRAIELTDKVSGLAELARKILRRIYR